MLRMNILVIFVVAINAAPSPYYSLIETPTSRFEQHYFTSPQQQQQPLEVHLKQTILPASTRYEYPDQHTVYYYPDMHMHNNQQNYNHHQLRHESWEESQNLRQNPVLNHKIRSEEQNGETESFYQKNTVGLSSKDFILKEHATTESIEVEKNVYSQQSFFQQTESNLESLSTTVKPADVQLKDEMLYNKMDKDEKESVEIRADLSFNDQPKDDKESIDVRADLGFNDQPKDDKESIDIRADLGFNDQPKDDKESVGIRADLGFNDQPKDDKESAKPRAEINLKNQPKDERESVEIRADPNFRNQPINEEKAFLGIEHNNLFQHNQMMQPLLHRLYTFNQQFYIATSPEFYGHFHPIHNPTAPIFSLQELQPITRENDNIESKSTKTKKTDALSMPSSTRRTSRINQDDEETKEDEVDSLRMQFSSDTLPSFSSLRIHVVDEDETEKNIESTHISARSKLSDNQISGESKEEEIMSRKEDKKQPSVVAQGRAISEESSVAQAKPSGTAVAGDGGVASSKPVATAVSGVNGLSVASPSATAVAGNFAFDDEDRKMKNKTRRTVASAQAFRRTVDYKDFL